MDYKTVANSLRRISKMSRAIVLVVMVCLSILGKAQPYAVGHTQITYTDPARAGRSIQTEIYYPAAASGTGVPVTLGSYPIIVFGHGFVMAWDAYQNIWEDLVPQGYIVAFPRTEGSLSPTHAEFGKDLKFLVGKLQSESATNSASLFYNRINSKSAIMGHSMGGGSSFLAAESNLNITTMVTFAAANTTPSSVTAAQNVSVPTLVFSGENDCVAPPAAHQIKMYDSLGSVCKTFISIKGGAHCEFANYNFNCSFGESTCSPTPTITRTEQQDATSDFLKLWLEYYLKDNCNSWNVFNDSLLVSPRITYDQQCVMNAPVITQVGMVLTSTPATTYQWYFNGTLIAGATSQNYTVTTDGNYYVEVTYFNTCPYQSNTINITSTGFVDDSNGLQWLVYPNPASDYLSINFNSAVSESIELRVINLFGQIIVEKKMEVVANSKNTQSISISNFEKGFYFIEIESQKGFKSTRKIIKE